MLVDLVVAAEEEAMAGEDEEDIAVRALEVKSI